MASNNIFKPFALAMPNKEQLEMTFEDFSCNLSFVSEEKMDTELEKISIAKSDDTIGRSDDAIYVSCQE